MAHPRVILQSLTYGLYINNDLSTLQNLKALLFCQDKKNFNVNLVKLTSTENGTKAHTCVDMQFGSCRMLPISRHLL
ncbi:hypothetical protein BDA96_03G168100 [Sorghum bicolor]|uniref:Uncharacterized protein n=2 Tax=Sorghum bicolor TaxID=4558 RepID=A0A921RD72_SORBI|nr:hypothetical protein BDA96_03G168100 [Sorghum bicolor]KXG32473.1 hypothetical protein SORBI_3003G159400 [Sorghum bicolor]